MDLYRGEVRGLELKTAAPGSNWRSRLSFFLVSLNESLPCTAWDNHAEFIHRNITDGSSAGFYLRKKEQGFEVRGVQLKDTKHKSKRDAFELSGKEKKLIIETKIARGEVPMYQDGEFFDWRERKHCKLYHGHWISRIDYAMEVLGRKFVNEFLRGDRDGADLGLVLSATKNANQFRAQIDQLVELADRRIEQDQNDDADEF